MSAIIPISRAEVDDLKSKINLVELFRQHGLELKQNGKGLVCRCPFHPDDKPSLCVTPDKGEWNCFGCEAGGDAIRFLQLKENLDFPQAVERLKQFAGIQSVNGVLPGKYRRPELLARVAELYHKRFLESEEAQAYLTGRGLGSEVWKAFKIGFCDGSLLKTLPNEGELLEALRSIGVLTKDNKEHFRGCVVVPLTHPDRGVVALYGRRIRPDAKICHLYLPGPRQGVLNWQAMKACPSVNVAESVLDALSLFQAGLRESTCLFGVQGLTDDFQELLARYKVSELTLCFDGDRAGLEATQKYTELFQSRGLKVLSARLPEGKDPNQVLTGQGGKALVDLVKQRESAPGPRVPLPEVPLEPTEDGFVLEVGEARYGVKLMGPFGSRLRLNLRANLGDKWLQDRFDLSLHRDQNRLAVQLASRLGLPRPDAERHRDVIFSHCEGWVTAQQAKAKAKDSPKPVEMSPEERQEALRFLRSPKLVDALLADMETMGYVGEEHGKLLVYLIGISRKLPRPMSGIILSAAGVGKSSLTELVEQLTPPEEVLLFTRITAQALVYMIDNILKGKLLIVEERIGAEAAEYSIRVLQSRQRLSQAVPLKDPTTGQIVTKFFTVEGPVAYLETTTNPKINHENATRCFEITLDESEAQTQRIQAFQRLRRMPTSRSHHQTEKDLVRRHHNAQRLLEEVSVFIPYADQLTFPSKKLRTRRDNERFLCLIEASAYLHQFQRERGVTEDGTPYVLANLDDYRLAYDLAKDVLSGTLHELTRGARELWGAIREWLKRLELRSLSDARFTRRELRAETGIEDHQLRASLQELVEMEYIEVVQGGNGKTFHYCLVVAEELNAPVTLLSPDELAARLKGRKG
jgi:DNA primase catalytic core